MEPEKKYRPTESLGSASAGYGPKYCLYSSFGTPLFFVKQQQDF
jgi:hypothetical protein